MIRVNKLRKEFGQFTAVDDLSFEVQEGEVLGFLGPNGAGKSTTMKMITGFLRPTSGEITFNHVSVLEEPKFLQKQLGYLPEGAPMYSDMIVDDFLGFIAEARGIRKDERQLAIDHVMERLELTSVRHRPIATLSKGYVRRVGIAQALIHDPKVLILDEPTDGLDPNQKHQIRRLIQDLSKDKIVIISTHILEEVSAVCSRALIISAGKKLLDEKPDDLAARSRFHNAVTIQFEGPIDSCIESLEEHLNSISNVSSIEWPTDDRLIVFPQPGKKIFSQVNEVIHQLNLPIENLHVEKGHLDDVFRDVTKGEVLS